MAENCCFVAIGIILGIGLLLIVILVPISFQGLEYYEIGFKRQKSTGKVNTDEVYDSGKHFVGPDYEFKSFKATAHFMDLIDLSVFTNGTSITLDVYFQFFLREKDLPILHEKYDINYESVIRKTAIAAVKAGTNSFTVSDFFEDRANVEKSLYRTVRDKLGGRCCRSKCSSWPMACPPGCTPLSQCKRRDDGGLWVDVKYFQMGPVVINSRIEDRFLKGLTEGELVKQEQLKQKAQVIRKATNALIKNVENEAREIRQKASSESQLISTVSKANYTLTVEKARSEGLKSLYKRLKITDQSVKSSFDYLRTLRGLDNVHFTVDFQQRIVGALG